jgi:hypothetical protein
MHTIRFSACGQALAGPKPFVVRSWSDSVVMRTSRRVGEIRAYPLEFMHLLNFRPPLSILGATCDRLKRAHRRGADWCDRSCAHKGRCAVRKYEAHRERRPRTSSEAWRGETGGPSR